MARVMPSNKEAEMSVLGICFIDDSLITNICDELNEEVFFDGLYHADFQHDSNRPRYV